MVHNGIITVTQQRYPQQPVPVYSYGPPTYQGPGGQQHAYGEIIFQLLTVSSYIAGIYTKYMKRLWYNKTVVLFKKLNRNVLLAVFILELSVLIKSLMFFFTMITLYVIFIIIFQFALMIYKKKNCDKCVS